MDLEDYLEAIDHMRDMGASQESVMRFVEEIVKELDSGRA